MSKPPEEDLNENLRLNYAKACKLLGVKEHAAVLRCLNPEADAAAPIGVIATDTPLGPAGVRALAAALLARGTGFKVPGYRHVKALRLWRSDARDSGAAAVAEVLRNGAHDKLELELVELMDSGLTPPGCGALGAALVMGANASLTTLRLDLNLQLGDEGVAALCRGLRSNRTLKVLTLAHCSLTGLAAASLAAEFLGSPLCVLEALDLTGNALAASGTHTLAVAAQKSRALKELILCDNQIGGGFLAAKESIMAASRSGLGDSSTTASSAAALRARVAISDTGFGGARAAAAVAAATERDATEDAEGSAQASRAAAGVAGAIETTAVATQQALAALGEALLSAECGLCRVNLEMNALTAADALVLVPFCSPANAKLEMLKVDATLPPSTFVALWRVPAAAKGKKKKKAAKK